MDCAPVSKWTPTMPTSSNFGCASCAATHRSPRPGSTDGPPPELRRRVPACRGFERHASRGSAGNVATGFALQAVAPDAAALDGRGAVCALHSGGDDVRGFDLRDLSNAPGRALRQHDAAPGHDDFLLRRLA